MPLAVAERRGLELAVAPVQLDDLAAPAHRDAGAVEIVDQVVGHRLAQVGAAVEERHESASVRKPDRRLGGGVAAADDADAGGAAPLRLLRPGRVEDADAFVGVDVGDRQPAVVGARREDDGAGTHLVATLEPDEMAIVAGLERERAIGRCGTGAELAGLRDGPGGELGAADAGREAEVVLDPARRARLAAEGAALDDERVEAFGRAVDGRAEPGRTAPDDNEVDLLARGELEPDAERRDTSPGVGLRSSGPPGSRTSGSASSPSPSIRASASDVSAWLVSNQVAGSRLRRAKSTIRRVASEECGPMMSCRRPRGSAEPSRRAMNVDSRRSLSGPSSNSSVLQLLALDGDVAHRLGHDGGQLDGLAG